MSQLVHARTNAGTHMHARTCAHTHESKVGLANESGSCTRTCALTKCTYALANASQRSLRVRTCMHSKAHNRKKQSTYRTRSVRVRTHLRTHASKPVLSRSRYCSLSLSHTHALSLSPLCALCNICLLAWFMFVCLPICLVRGFFFNSLLTTTNRAVSTIPAPHIVITLALVISIPQLFGR